MSNQVLRKIVKFYNSLKRKEFSTRVGRISEREWYVQFLTSHPFDDSLFRRFYIMVKENFTEIEMNEEGILDIGYF